MTKLFRDSRVRQDLAFANLIPTLSYRLNDVQVIQHVFQAAIVRKSIEDGLDCFLGLLHGFSDRRSV